MVKLLETTKPVGAAWTSKAVEVSAVLFTKDTVTAFLNEHPDAVGP